MERRPQKNLKKEMVGVKLMQEPGFAAPGIEAGHKRRHHLMVRNQKEEIFKSTPTLNMNCKPLGERRAMSSISCYSSRSTRIEEPLERHRSSRHHKSSSNRRQKGYYAGESPSTDCIRSISVESVTSQIPSIPINLLKALGTREVPLLGKVRVSVRLSPLVQCGEPSILTLDKKNRLVIHEEPKTNHFNRIGVSAPKIYAFDQVFSKEDDQNYVVSKVIPDILQAVLGGNDGCILGYGGSGMGKTYTMVLDNGIMPSTICWLYQAVNHLRNHNAVKFSIRVSAAVVDASGKTISDALASCANESEIFPSALLRQGYLSSLAELRAPSAEAAAKYLDLALAYRQSYNANKPTGVVGASTLLYTLHVYQQSIDAQSRGKVVGARSRLHLLDLGDMSGHNKGSLSLSGLTSVLLSIFNGKKYLPHKSNKLTHLLQEALGSVTCHASMIVHVSPSQRHSQHALATLQLASRVHRLRRKKVKGVFSFGSSNSSEGSKRRSSGGSSAGSSSVDFSSSEQSADTVIYMGGGEPGDSTDGEHPPMFFPHHIRRHRSVDLPRFGSFERLQGMSPLSSNHKRRTTSASPTPTSRSAPLARVRGAPCRIPKLSSNILMSSNSSLGGKPVFFRHQPGVSRINYSDNEQSTKFKGPSSRLTSTSTGPLYQEEKLKSPLEMQYQFYREPNSLVPVFSNANGLNNNNHIENNASTKGKRPCHSSESLNSKHKESLISDEQWIDGPRVSKHRSKTSQNTRPEMWVDGPSSSIKLTATNYGFMDDHKKTMIEKWVQHQTAQIGGSEAKNTSFKTPMEHKSTNIILPLGENFNAINNDDVTIESDIDTISEDQSTTVTEGKQPNLITELERKNLIPPFSEPYKEQHIESLESPEREEISIDEVCSQCEALSEECKELSSLCEEELNLQAHQGLATVVEEPELESVYGRIEDPIDLESLRNNPNTDHEGEDQELSSECASNKKNFPIEPSTKHRFMAIKKTADSSVQVYQEDITRTLCTTPSLSEFSISETSDDHPLRVLSEENLSCSSTFTDCLSQNGEAGSDLQLDCDMKSIEGSELIFDTNYLSNNFNCQELTALHDHFSALKGNSESLRQQMSFLHNESITKKNLLKNKNDVIEEDILSRNNSYFNSDQCRDKKSFYRKEVQQPFSSFDKCTSTEQNPRTSQRNELLLNASSLHCISEGQPLNTAPKMSFPVVTNSLLNLNSISPNLINVQNDDESTRICDPSAVFSCGSTISNFNNLEESVSPIDNDSDCHSNESADSDIIGRGSKFSKFLCVGLGRSKPKSGKSCKTKNVDEKKSFAKQSKHKTVISSSSKLLKQDLNSKNLKKSPSQTPPVVKDCQISSHVVPLNLKNASEATPLNKDTKKSSYTEEPCYQNVISNRHEWNEASMTPVTSCGSSQAEMPPSCQVKVVQAITTSGSLGTTQSLGESSGYESILRDSECSSFSSSQESEADEEYRREHRYLRRGISFKKCARAQPSSILLEAAEMSALKHMTEGSRSNLRNKLSK